MFNESNVSSFVQTQFPSFTQEQYPTLVQFVQNYYKFLESNGNPLDLQHGLLDLTDIDTYGQIDLTASTKEPIAIDDTEISVIGHVKFPRTDGLLKIDDEVILYKEREYITDEFGSYKLTIFKGCVRGYTYNDLTYEDGFVPSIETVASAHTPLATVVNQSFNYLLFFLDKLRNQFLVNYPQNSLTENRDKLDITNILKRAKDFYLTKGTPKGIEFYFKSLFQDVPEIVNYNQNLISPSNATYQSKFVIRTESLDNYYIPELVGNTLVQNGKEFNVQTVENNFAGASQVYELEISNGQNILPTQFCIITQFVQNNRLYVDTTYGFPNSGFIRIGNEFVEYTKKEYNYFEIVNTPSFYELGQRIYDVNTLASVKNRPDSYFLIFAGVTGFDILKNYSYYQENDIGFVKDVAVDISDVRLNTWITNENIPFSLNKTYISGVSSIFTDQESLYIYSSGLPYYSFTEPSNVEILDSRHFKRIPIKFEKSLEGFKEATIPDFPVGFLLDGTPILNWKSNIVLVRGSLKNGAVNVVQGGSEFNVNSPPSITFTSPSNDDGTTAEGHLVINGSVKEVFVEDSGKNYPPTTVITVIKDPTDTEFTGDKFRTAIIEPVIVKGKIARIKVLDPGKGYSKQPTLRISPELNIDDRATLSLLVDGSISRVNITNSGSRYDSDPSALISYGDGGSAVLTIENGRITNIQSVNNGQNYKSPPIVKVVDPTGSGQGAKIISKINPVNGAIIEYKILNAGINYSQFGTFVEIYEAGSGQFLEPQIDRWTLVNNFNTDNNNYYLSDSGAFLFGTESLQDLERANPKVEEIPYNNYTEVLTAPNGAQYMGIYPEGQSNGNLVVTEPISYDLLAASGYDLIDEGYIGLEVPFDIKFGSTSSTPVLVKKDEKIYINSNGFVTFNQSPITGWASEQLTPTSIGPSIQIGKDDLIIDKIFASYLKSSSVDIYTILTIDENDLIPDGEFNLIFGAAVIDSWPSDTIGLYFFGGGSRYLQTNNYNTLAGGALKFDFIYSLPPITVGERADTNEEVRVEYSLNNGSTWIVYKILNYGQYLSGQWQEVVIPLEGPLQSSQIKFRIRQQNFSANSFDTWGLRDISLNINKASIGLDKYIIRFEGFHFLRGLNKTNPIKYELIIEEQSNIAYDNTIIINVIENDFANTDNKALLFTYGDDDSYEFPTLPLTAGKSYEYSTEIIPASSVKFPKDFTILGAPKKLKLSSGTVNFTDPLKHSPLIGWALDGSPIYGPYGYSNALDEGSPPKKMVSGWKLINTNDPSYNPVRLLDQSLGGLSNYTTGAFKEDYYYTTVGATLDEQNGRYCVTPEFPKGVYAYFMTIDINDKQNGFPYFIGEFFSGKTYSEFNTSDTVNYNVINNLTRYLNPSTNLYEKTRPLDPGSFTVSSVPSSINATIDSVNVIEGGAGYKVNDKLIFDNTGTEGFSAAGFVSLIEGKPVSSTTFNFYDYLEYEDENVPFTSGSTIATADGFEATIHSINPNDKYMYLSEVSGSNPSKNEIIYDTTLTPEVLVETELVGFNFTEAVTSALATTAQLTVAIDSTSTYLTIGNFANCTISDFYSTTIPKYIKIDEEYIRVISIVDSTHIIVRRGISSLQETHSINSQITLLSELPVFDSSKYNRGDIIKVDGEIFKVIDISVRKNPEKLFTKIIDGSGTTGANIYYLFINEILQENSLAPIPTQATITLNQSGDVADLSFDDPSSTNPNLPPISANPKIEILTTSTYVQSNIVSNINIVGSSYQHVLIVERAAFNTNRELHYPRSKVNRLIYVNAKVLSYEEDRILARFNSESNGLLQGDEITVNASRSNENNYTLRLTTAGALTVTKTGGSGESYTSSGSTVPLMILYEQSEYIFEVAANSNSVKVEFYSLSDSQNKEKQYFDLDTNITQNSTGRVTEFKIIPKNSDLTNLIMRITSLSTGISRDIRLNIQFEPYNGIHIVENAASNFFEFYINRNPIFTDYTSNTISYITRSKTASGPIYRCTLTSGGFNYKTLPSISSVSSVFGKGASLEALSTAIGSVKSIDNTSNGYGYNPNSSYAPIISFPVICKLKNNFKVISCNIENSGSGYLFQPNFIVTGGGLGNNDPGHAVVSAVVSNEKIFAINVEFSGYSYSSAPIINVEKTYFTTINSNGDLAFKFNFNKYFQENDAYKVRAYYYDSNNNLLYRESSITFYADLQTSAIKSRTVISGTSYVNPKDYIDENGISVEYYKVDLLERKASITALVDKSDFIPGEKIIINNESNIFGYVSTEKGWQRSNSIIRIVGLQYSIKENDFIRGVDSESYGKVEFVDGVDTKLKLGAYLQKPKQFLNNYSFLSDNILKIQDNFRYQKFAYEISTNIPFNNWKENYIQTAHPAGYNLFAKTKINQKVKLPTTVSTKVKVSTDVSSLVRLNQKYNYLLTKNIDIDEVEVANRLLTDVKEITTSVVAAFEDFSSEFDGVKSSFELKVIDPITPKLSDGVTDNYITDYDVDQMVVILDNIIQTYGDSWTVTDSDKTFNFESVQQAGEYMPDGELLFYRQLNESNQIYGFNTITTSSTTTFNLVEEDNTPFPSSVIGGNYNPEDWLVFVDGVLQLSEISTPSYSIFTGQLVFTETVPSGSQVSARCIVDSHKNEFVNSTYNQGSTLTLLSKPVTTSKESYFVFVNGILIPTSDFDLDGSNNIIFNYNYSFDYESIIVFIDALGVSLETSYHNIIQQLYNYKIEDGQVDIPVGLVLDTNQYILDINGVVQTPFISYTAGASGVRKINFSEPPQKYTKGDIEVGRQFIGLLYQREDVRGDLGSTPNYQFDDISKNRIFIKNSISDLIVGDYIIDPTNNSNAVVNKIVDRRLRKLVLASVNQTVAQNATFDVPLSSISDLVIGDRVIYDVAIGLNDPINQQLEITAINKQTSTVTLKNISSEGLQIIINQNNSLRFSHRELIVIDITTSQADRDDAFGSNNTLLSGYISAVETPNQTALAESYMVLETDTEITVYDATSISIGDYLLINNVEVVKVTNKSGNILTIDRSQLATFAPIVHANNSNVTKIEPIELQCSSFIRGFDKNKLTFPLLEKENPVYIEANKDIFVIINGILQKRGESYTIIENDPDGIPNSGDEFSQLQFTEAPSDSTPFNCFYVGETIAIQNISGQFNSIKTSFDLRSVTGEIFSLIAKSRVNSNISANLILFIDGVYQIPSTTEPGRLESYDDIISSYKLLGSIIDFTSPPKKGSDFEGYIYVGSTQDYKSTNVDVTVEEDDILIQYNEISPRRILQRTSATNLSVSESLGLISPGATGIDLGGENQNNWWQTDLIKVARVRESLRARRSIVSEIVEINDPSYPPSGVILDTSIITSIDIKNVSSDLPISPDDDTNKINFILPSNANFPDRVLTFTYVSFVARNPLIENSKDVIQNLKIVELPFNQILKVSVPSGSTDELENYFYAGDANISEFRVVSFDKATGLVYIKLTNTTKPVVSPYSITIGPYTIINHDLIDEYQTLTAGTKLIYNF